MTDRRAIEPPTSITRSTLIPISLVIGLIAVSVSVTRAWEQTNYTLAETRRELTSMQATLAKIQEASEQTWTVRDQRGWIAAAERLGLRLPSVESARFALQFPFSPWPDPPQQPNHPK